jgi:hypothetical protein
MPLLSTAPWWQIQHDTSTERTPLARLLPRVIGSISVLETAAQLRQPILRGQTFTTSVAEPFCLLSRFLVGERGINFRDLSGNSPTPFHHCGDDAI